jgi:ATP-binding cassette, sub-family E, member 1
MAWLEGTASTPLSQQMGMNTFLKSIQVTLRRDPVNLRPRINKFDSVKDREQKALGMYYIQDKKEEQKD